MTGTNTQLNTGTTAIVVGNGGTGVSTMTTAYAPVCAGTTATGALQVASTGLSTTGNVLTSNGSSALPSWQAGALPSLGARFWIQVTGDGTTINTRTGVTYVTHNSAGNLTITFITPFATANYVVVSTSGKTTAGYSITDSGNLATGSCRVLSFNSSASATDPVYIFAVGFGAQ
jgi:hypothetical protein